MKKTALIILNYNNVEDTINCIRSVLKYNTAPVKFVVVDNGSPRARVVQRLDRFMSETFGSGYTRIQENAPVTWPYLNQATLLVSKHNDGYACGNNKGLRLVDKDPEIDHVMILNNDILFIQDIIPGLLAERRMLDNCAIISPVLYTRDNKTIDVNCARKSATVFSMIKAHLLHYLLAIVKLDGVIFDKKRYLLNNNNIPKECNLRIDLPSGACMLISKSLFKDIDWFDPYTFLYYEEDILHKKIQRIGLSNYICTKYRCIHLGAVSTSKSSGLYIIKKGMSSQRYYVMNYSNVSLLTKMAFLMSQRLDLWATITQKKIMHKK